MGKEFYNVDVQWLLKSITSTIIQFILRNEGIDRWTIRTKKSYKKWSVEDVYLTEII